MSGSKKRKYKRYDISHSQRFGGTLTQAGSELKLATIGLGGCGFYSDTLDPELAPPSEIICSIFATDETGLNQSEFVVGNVIYTRPANSTTGQPAFHYGVCFHQEEQEKIGRMIGQLEDLAESGEVSRA